MNDPFNRARLPAKFDRAGRIELIGRAAQYMFAGRLPGQGAAIILASTLLAWVQ